MSKAQDFLLFLGIWELGSELPRDGDIPRSRSLSPGTRPLKVGVPIPGICLVTGIPKYHQIWKQNSTGVSIGAHKCLNALKFIEVLNSKIFAQKRGYHACWTRCHGNVAPDVTLWKWKKWKSKNFITFSQFVNVHFLGILALFPKKTYLGIFGDPHPISEKSI